MIETCGVVDWGPAGVGGDDIDGAGQEIPDMPSPNQSQANKKDIHMQSN